jgi:AcrR family transcriptional regulator
MQPTESARDRMITGAIELFRERGVGATSMSDVIERSGAPRGSLYHYFPRGKAQLAEEATATAGRLMVTSINTLSATKGPAQALSKIIGYFRKQLVQTDFAAGCPVAAGALADVDAPGARAVAGETFSAWEQALSTAMWQAGVSTATAETFATMAVASVEGALLVARAQRSTRALDRVERFLTAQLGALTGEPTAE